MKQTKLAGVEVQSVKEIFLSIQDIDYWFNWVVGLGCSLVGTIMGSLGFGFREQLRPIVTEVIRQVLNCFGRRSDQPQADLQLAEAGRVRPNVAAAAAAMQRNTAGNNPFIY